MPAYTFHGYVRQRIDWKVEEAVRQARSLQQRVEFLVRRLETEGALASARSEGAGAAADAAELARELAALDALVLTAEQFTAFERADEKHAAELAAASAPEPPAEPAAAGPKKKRGKKP